MTELQFQGFVERYVATLFAQCRQIATVFETGDEPRVANITATALPGIVATQHLETDVFPLEKHVTVIQDRVAVNIFM